MCAASVCGVLPGAVVDPLRPGSCENERISESRLASDVLWTTGCGVVTFVEADFRCTPLGMHGPAKPPTLRIDRERMPVIARHIERAQAAGHPRLLTRSTDGINFRRRAAQGCHLREDGMSLDEYPPASTEQGGSGASVANVPRRENCIQGGVMAMAYRTLGLAAGAPFFVEVVDSVE